MAFTHLDPEGETYQSYLRMHEIRPSYVAEHQDVPPAEVEEEDESDDA